MSKYAKIGILASALFILIGYYYSDSRYFDEIIEKQRIKTPTDAFNFIEKETKPIQPLTVKNAINGLSPRYLLTTRKYLWCDEGAILLLVFSHQLGYKTRLVDLLDNEVSRHTIAEVWENDHWVTYDYTNNKIGISYDESAAFYKPVERLRPYPKFYNFLVHNNYFLKKIALRLRSIPETEIPVFDDNPMKLYK